MLIKVHVETNAKNETVRPGGTDRLYIRVREKPEQNAANARVIEIVAKHFQVPERSVRIISGHHKQSKLLQIWGKK